MPRLSAHDEGCDVLVIGNGLVGGPLAIALAQAGLRVVCLDHTAPAAVTAAGFDGRASAVALASQRLLAAIGLWPKIAAAAEPIREIRVSDGASPFYLHYDHRALGDEPLGWMAENRVLRLAIQARLAELPEARLQAPVRLAGLDREAERVVARLADGRRLTAGLAVAADGRNSATRGAAGIGTNGWDYGQHGIVCTVAHERPHRGIAQERFLPPGPFAILPLTGNRASIVWTEKAALAPAIVGQDDAGFLAELRQRFTDYLGDLSLAGPRFSHPLSLRLADTMVTRRLALVGDAAHAMHPLAGQGMNIGLRDVAALAEALVDARRLGLDIGAAPVLERYQRRRRFDGMLMLAMTDGLNRLFSNDIPPLRLLRDAGLGAVHRLPGLKALFMRQAMGLAGDPPRLLRGEPL